MPGGIVLCLTDVDSLSPAMHLQFSTTCTSGFEYERTSLSENKRNHVQVRSQSRSCVALLLGSCSQSSKTMHVITRCATLRNI